MKSNVCFVDTVCWIALLNRQDRFHDVADKHYKNLMRSGTRFVTTTSVLDETANVLCDPAFKPSVITFHRNLETSSRVEIIFIDPMLWSKVWALYEDRKDKSWSLMDCIYISIMQERGIDDLLTSDQHFVQAGFHALLIERDSSGLSDIWIPQLITQRRDRI